MQGANAQSAKPAAAPQSLPPATAADALAPQGSAVRDVEEGGNAPAQAAQHVTAAPAALPAQHASAAQAQPQQAQTLFGEVNNAVGAIAMPTPADTPHSWEDTGASSLLIALCEGSAHAAMDGCTGRARHFLALLHCFSVAHIKGDEGKSLIIVELPA